MHTLTRILEGGGAGSLKTVIILMLRSPMLGSDVWARDLPQTQLMPNRKLMPNRWKVSTPDAEQKRKNDRVRMIP